jgi:precorrin-6B methylase 1
VTLTHDPLTTTFFDTRFPADPAGLEGFGPVIPSFAVDTAPVLVTNVDCGFKCPPGLWTPPAFSETNFALLTDVVSRHLGPGATFGMAKSEARPSLMVVGMGIRTPGQLTAEARRAIASADRVFYAADRGAAHDAERFASEVAAINSNSEPVPEMQGVMVDEQFDRLADAILAPLSAGQSVCFVTYGHPGICYYLCHELIRRARADKFPALMLPAVSSLDGLFADLAFDPARLGVQVFDAVEFVARTKKVDDTIPIVLLQPYRLEPERTALVTRLKAYPKTHQCFLYRAAPSVDELPNIQPLTVADLVKAEIPPDRILFIPARTLARIDKKLRDRLGQ